MGSFGICEMATMSFGNEGQCNDVGMVRMAGRCFDVSVAVDCPKTHAPAVSIAFPPGTTPVPPSAEVEETFLVEPSAIHADHLIVKRRGVQLACPQPVEVALRTLQKEVSWTIAERSASYVVIHAGVIAWNDLTVVFPGSSHDGKSTLVWSLVQAGATYFSDEYAVFDERGFVHPFPVPISLRGEAGGVHSLSPLQVAKGPVSPAIVAAARYERDAVWNPRLLSPGEAFLLLAKHSISIRSNAQFVLPVVKNVAVRAQGFSGLRGDVTQMLAWLNLLANELGNS